MPAEERGRAFGRLFWYIAIGQLIGACLGATVPARTAIPELLWVSMAGCPVVLIGVLLSYSREATGKAGIGGRHGKGRLT